MKLNFLAFCVLCRDWNGSKRGHVYKFLRSQGFVSSYDTAHHYTDSDADAHKVVIFRFMSIYCLILLPTHFKSLHLVDLLFFLLQWVSHRNHRGNICGVDFIWLLNPIKHRKPLRTSWNEAVFGIIKVRDFSFLHMLSTSFFYLFLFDSNMN